MKKALLFTNGLPPEKMPSQEEYECVVCTDGAYNYLKYKNISIDVVIGDFDSIEEDLFIDGYKTQCIKIEDQDTTDFQKALQYLVENGFQKVDVYGASGGAQDHFLGNVSAAVALKNSIEIHFFDDVSEYYFIPNNWTLNHCLDKTISLYPFPICKGIRTTGLQYPLNNEDLNQLGRIGIRNTAIEDTISVSFQDGELLVFIER